MSQLLNTNQIDGPDEPIVNEQEQDKEVNLQDEKFESGNKEKGYEEGKRNDSDTEVTTLVQNHELENLPGTEVDPKKPLDKASASE